MAFNGKFVLNLAQYASQQQGEIDQVIGFLNQTPEELCLETSVVSNADYNQTIENAVNLSQDMHLGLHAGEHLNLAAAGLIGQITQTCATVKQALNYCCEFANLGCSVLPMSLEELPHAYRVKITPDIEWSRSSAIAYKHTVNGVLAFSIREIESLTLGSQAPIKIHLPWPKPNDASEYERIFNTTVLFDQDEIAIYLDKSQVEAPVIHANYDLLRILVSHATQKSEQLAQEHGFKSLVHQSVLKLIKPNFPNIDQVAGHLNMSARTLQRKLKEEGVTFQKMLGDLRFDLAKTYLINPKLSIKEIGYLLGYAEPSVFIRSFKTRTGQPPQRFRENLGQV